MARQILVTILPQQAACHAKMHDHCPVIVQEYVQELPPAAYGRNISPICFTDGLQFWINYFNVPNNPAENDLFKLHTQGFHFGKFRHLAPFFL